ncbi:MAG: bifunctional alpha,alpha-trehalose-phosphate synthase (UDP-forming)/trehalose-phosphatase [Chloroflexi bacterium]|nr:bifunctional alpha,alpha-trehalose-phosphate synthase (UDP-forming)/trehalose-phosphatase [Chloroflexota bacterium]
MASLVLVSNRLPVTVRRGKQGAELVRSSGGLVSALEPVHARGESLWVGNLGGEPTRHVERELTASRYVNVPVSAAETRDYYLGYSNSALWPLFHYFQERCVFSRSQFATYRRVNERFAEHVARHSDGATRVWVHDYQLMLVPGFLRKLLPAARIGFFLHTPFPSSEIFRLLPEREEILDGLLGADVIGVHTYDYARHLVNTLRRVKGVAIREGLVELDGRNVQIATQPVGIDLKKVKGAAYTQAAESRVNELRGMLAGRRMILGVDRLDYTKALPLKLEAFRKFLERSTRWRHRVIFIQIAVPSRTEIPSYRHQKEEVDRLVGEINGAYGTPGRTPIHYVFRSISPTELGALYRAADVAFVAPVRDGMNLVAKEYVACQPEDAGVLVLSEFAGAAPELREAIRVNPYDIEGTAEALEKALEMPVAERQRRMTAMLRRIELSDVHAWERRALRSLEAPRPAVLGAPAMYEPEALADKLRPALRNSRAPLFMFDYDGTLREFVAVPSDARPTAAIMRLLEAAASMSKARVFLISGRDRDSMTSWFGELGIGLVAEHGAFRRNPGTGAEWVASPGLADARWKDEVRPILVEYAQRTPGASVEEKTGSLAWHFRNAEQDLALWQARELNSHLEEYLVGAPIEVMQGAKIVEVRQQGVTKGAAFKAVVEELGPFDFILALGDDTTDEDTFAALPESAHSVHVGEGSSRASASLASPAAVRGFIRSLLSGPAATQAAG